MTYPDTRPSWLYKFLGSWTGTLTVAALAIVLILTVIAPLPGQEPQAPVS